MSELSNSSVWLLALVVIGIVGVLFRVFFNRDARERRRRQRSHGRVISKVARPMVKLAVEAEAAPAKKD
jgi:hypothetical protein